MFYGNFVFGLPSKFRMLKVLGYRSGDLDQEEIHRRDNDLSSTAGVKTKFY